MEIKSFTADRGMLPNREHTMSEFLRRHERPGLVPIAIMTSIF